MSLWKWSPILQPNQCLSATVFSCWNQQGFSSWWPHDPENSEDMKGILLVDDWLTDCSYGFFKFSGADFKASMGSMNPPRSVFWPRLIKTVLQLQRNTFIQYWGLVETYHKTRTELNTVTTFGAFAPFAQEEKHHHYPVIDIHHPVTLQVLVILHISPQVVF